MRIFYRIVCLFLLSGTSMAVSAQNATFSHYMVFQIPIDTFKVVFDWDYSNPYAISTSDTIDVSSFKKGEIVSKQYVNIPFLVKSDSNVVNVIKLTPNDLLKLPPYGINTWERITKGYNLEINYDTFGTQLVVDDELIPMGKTTLTLEPSGL